MKKSVFICIGLLVSFTTMFGQAKNFIDQPYVEVVGVADTLVTPNEIFLKIVISEKDTKDKYSVEEMESKMIASLQELRINTEKELTTSDMLSNYKSYFLKGKEVVKSKEYILKVKDAATVARVFAQLESIGLSNTTIDRVNHSEKENIQNLCRTAAVKDAKRKAIALTKPLGQTIGLAIYISDQRMGFDAFEGRMAGVVAMGYALKSKSNYEPAKIEFEKVKISANVNVYFILK